MAISANSRSAKTPKLPSATSSKRGYPPEALLVYLMSIANSNFRGVVDCRDKTLDISKSFPFDLHKMSLDGALFDIDKLNYFSKEIHREGARR
jgi:hypothetical protein